MRNAFRGVLINKKLIMKKTIFEENKTFSDVLIEGIVFAVSTTLILTFTAAIIILITNLIF